MKYGKMQGMILYAFRRKTDQSSLIGNLTLKWNSHHLQGKEDSP